MITSKSISFIISTVIVVVGIIYPMKLAADASTTNYPKIKSVSGVKRKSLADEEMKTQVGVSNADSSIIESPSVIDQYMQEISTKHTSQIDYSIFDLRTASGYNSDNLNALLTKTRLKGMGETFYKAERYYGVNSLFLIALSGEESGFGASNIAVGKNNIFGFHAYDNNPELATKYSSLDECVYSVAKYLAENYLYEKGLYFKGYTLSDVNYHYCTNHKWAGDIASIMSKLDSE